MLPNRSGSVRGIFQLPLLGLVVLEGTQVRFST